MAKKLLFLIILLYSTAPMWAQQSPMNWPQPPALTQQLVRQMIGAYRNTGVPRFHRGLDLTQDPGNGIPSTTNVYAANSGPVSYVQLNDSSGNPIPDEVGVQIGNLTYLHVIAIQSIKNGTLMSVTEGQKIGTLYLFGPSIKNHVHYQYKDRENPLIYLTPFQNLANPAITGTPNSTSKCTTAPKDFRRSLKT